MSTDADICKVLEREARILSIAQQLSRVHLLKNAEQGFPVAPTERQELVDRVMARAAVINRDLAPLMVDSSHGTTPEDSTLGLMGEATAEEAHAEVAILSESPAVRTCLEGMTFAELVMLVDAGIIPADAARQLRSLCPTDRTDKAVASFLLAQSKPAPASSTAPPPAALPRPHAPYTHRPSRGQGGPSERSGRRPHAGVGPALVYHPQDPAYFRGGGLGAPRGGGRAGRRGGQHDRTGHREHPQAMAAQGYFAAGPPGQMPSGQMLQGPPGLVMGGHLPPGHGLPEHAPRHAYAMASAGAYAAPAPAPMYTPPMHHPGGLTMDRLSLGGALDQHQHALPPGGGYYPNYPAAPYHDSGLVQPPQFAPPRGPTSPSVLRHEPAHDALHWPPNSSQMYGPYSPYPPQ